MLNLSDITYSVLRAFRDLGFDIADEESQGFGEQSILLTTDSISPTAITFNQGISRWKVYYTMIGRGSTKKMVLDLLDEFLIATHDGVSIPISTTTGAFTASLYGILTAQGEVLLNLPYSWTFSQQFTLEVYEEV